MNIDKLVNKFRIASRELFNNYFLEQFLENEDWEFHELFTCIEEELFHALISSRIGIKKIEYGCYPQTEIEVIPTALSTCGIPIMLNRNIDSGYWDHQIDRAEIGCVFSFLTFFDWDQKAFKDNRYVRAIVNSWPEHPELIGKHALIETTYVSYRKA
jgi:hypothetical protein